MKSAEGLVAKFAEAVRGQNDAINDGDHRRGNRFARQYVRAFEDLCALGDAGRNALAILLESTDRGVRVMAASFLLRHMHPQARSVLEVAAREGGLIGFEAAQTLERWEEGTWNLDPVEKAE